MKLKNRMHGEIFPYKYPVVKVFIFRDGTTTTHKRALLLWQLSQKKSKKLSDVKRISAPIKNFPSNSSWSTFPPPLYLCDILPPDLVTSQKENKAEQWALHLGVTMATFASRHVYKLHPGSQEFIAITCVERDLLIFGVISCSWSGCIAGERAKSGNKRKDGQLQLLQK